MSGIDSKALSEMEALVQERQKYEKWIHSLEERRGVTPSHVYQRVLHDYQERVRSVVESLGGRSSEIEASIASLRDRLTQLQREETASSDERAEAELRAAVGEFSQDRWEEIRRNADESIARLSATRLELGAELSHLESILSVAMSRPSVLGGSGSRGDGSGNAGGAPDAPESRRPEPAPAKESVAAAPPPPPAARPVVMPEIIHDRSTFDELAFLSSVVENEISQMPSQPADIARPSRAESTRTETTRTSDSQRDAERSQVSTATPSVSRIVRSATPLITEPVHSDGNDAAARSREDLRADPMGRRLSGSVPAYLKDVTKEMTKSLKCQECGTMNYPTEWYCERCGGELAAL